MIESLWAVQNINMNRWYTSHKPQLPACWSSMVQTVFNTIVSSGTLLMSFSLFCNVMLYMCLHTFNSIQLFAGLGTGVSMLSVHLFCFIETQKTQTKFKKSSLIKYPLWGVFQPPSVLKTSAVFVPWTLLTFHGHRDNHSDCFHTKTSKAVCTWFCQWGVQLLTSHVLLVLMQTTHNNTQWIYVPPEKACCQYDTRHSACRAAWTVSVNPHQRKYAVTAFRLRSESESVSVWGEQEDVDADEPQRKRTDPHSQLQSQNNSSLLEI